MSKLNPQKASAYVGPGVLRKGGKITPVPNGPLIKKKGVFKGSTLKSGGSIRKAQGGDTLTVKKPTWQKMTQAEKTAKRAELIAKGGNERFKQYKDSISADAKNRLETQFAEGAAKRGMTPAEYSAYIKKQAKGGDAPLEGLDIKGSNRRGETKGSCRTGQSNRGESLRDNQRNGGSINTNKLGIMNKKKTGGAIKKAQTGRSIGTQVVEENKRQQKRLGRIRETNPERASKVEGRMVRRANRAMNARGAASRMKDGGSIKGITNQPKLPKLKKLSAEEMKVPAKVDISKFNKAKPKAKAGAMIKRADGSMSRRGLWDNIRANKGSGKKPTAAMLKQEKKIKAKSKK